MTTKVANPPLISVVIPSFNREHFLNRCLDSVTRQSYTNIEVLLIDDHSTDQTVRLVNERMMQDSRIRLLNNTHAKGISGARNTGLDAAQGDFIAFQDTDDTWSPDHLTDAMDCLLQFTEIDCYSANRVNINERDEISLNLFEMGPLLGELDKKRLDDNLYLIVSDMLDGTLDDLIVDIHTLVIRKSSLGSVRFSESRKVTNDREFVVDLAWDRTRKWAIRTKVSAQVYRHGGNITSDDSESCIRRLTTSVDFYDRLLASDRLDRTQRSKVTQSLRNRLLELPYHLRATGRHPEALKLIKAHAEILGRQSTAVEYFKTRITQLQSSLAAIFASSRT